MTAFPETAQTHWRPAPPTIPGSKTCPTRSHFRRRGRAGFLSGRPAIPPRFHPSSFRLFPLLPRQARSKPAPARLPSLPLLPVPRDTSNFPAKTTAYIKSAELSKRLAFSSESGNMQASPAWFAVRLHWFWAVEFSCPYPTVAKNLPLPLKNEPMIPTISSKTRPKRLTRLGLQI